MIQYSNPRKEATFTDWPYGVRGLKTTVTFEIEKGNRGERAVRTTVNPKTGVITTPKVLTYTNKACIVDGDDGKTYIAELSIYGMISIMKGSMNFQEESIHEGDTRYPQLLSLFESD